MKYHIEEWVKWPKWLKRKKQSDNEVEKELLVVYTIIEEHLVTEKEYSF